MRKISIRGTKKVLVMALIVLSYKDSLFPEAQNQLAMQEYDYEAN
jgi:hypothetical protein